MNVREIMTIKQVAEFLQLNYYTVYRLITSGQIPGSQVGTQWRVQRQDVLNYLEKQKNPKKRGKRPKSK